jgi:hypothetical protein
MPTLRITLYAQDIEYVYAEYALDTKVQQCEESSVSNLDHCNLYEIKI